MEKEKNTDIELGTELKKSFLDYSVSVIIGRALPDIRDGLKPIHRRIIYTMNEIGLKANKKYKKSAKIVGEVIAKYHPHGDASVYDTIVRMAQDFNYRYCIVDGQGNFGSIDGDAPAAMRYTEARMTKIAGEIVRDIEFNTVDFQDNYDNTEKEPTVLPSRIPSLLINGSIGIAVGMSTYIPPHNLHEVINGVICYIKNKDCTVEDLNEWIKGPDFPTGGIIFDKASILDVYKNGHGCIIMRCKYEIIEKDTYSRIVITEIPYLVNKATLIMTIAELVNDKKIDGIRDVRDETSREGMRIVIETKKGFHANAVLNKLFKMTSLQSNFNVRMLAIQNNQPRENLTLKELVKAYYDHQINILNRKYTFLLKKDQKRKHILEAFKICIDNIEEIIKIIKNSEAVEDIYKSLEKIYGFSDEQIKAILDMRLQKLSKLDYNQIKNEMDTLIKQIEEYEILLNNSDKIDEALINDLVDIKESYKYERRSVIQKSFLPIGEEDLVNPKEVVIFYTQQGFIKAIDIDTFREQNRAGKGVKSTSLYEDDEVREIIYCSTVDDLLFFTNRGRFYKIKAYKIPNLGKLSKGTSINNIIPYLKSYDEEVVGIVKENNEDGNSLLILTKKGMIKKIEAKHFEKINKNGKICITGLDEHGDFIENIKLTSASKEIIIGTNIGKVIRFNEEEIKPTGRTSYGVKAINVSEQLPISLTTTYNGELLLAISSLGYGKISSIEDYRKTKRNSKGVIGFKISPKTGKPIFIGCVSGNENVLISTKFGKTININLKTFSIIGRNTMGVKLIDLEEDNEINNVTILRHEEHDNLIEEPTQENEQN